jgi:hypothetical protein
MRFILKSWRKRDQPRSFSLQGPRTAEYCKDGGWSTPLSNLHPPDFGHGQPQVSLSERANTNGSIYLGISGKPVYPVIGQKSDRGRGSSLRFRICVARWSALGTVQRVKARVKAAGIAVSDAGIAVTFLRPLVGAESASSCGVNIGGSDHHCSENTSLEMPVTAKVSVSPYVPAVIS